jgi:large subunit ribosomal protein L25
LILEEAMREITLKSRIREGIGKKMAHRLRAEGEVPAILYGHKADPMKLSVPEHELWTILHNATSEHLILKLEIEDGGGEEVLTLVRDVQHHPVTGEILHIDFQRISVAEHIKVGVPIDLVGQSTGVKEFGGILDHSVREVMVRCKPVEIPDALEIDVSSLQIGQSIHLSDIMEEYRQLEFLDDPHLTLAHVSPPKKLEVAVEEGAEAAVSEAAAEGEAEPEEEETAEETEES